MSAPTPLRVRLPFRSEDEFVASYGAHVGRDGFFLATRVPKPVGAALLFDLILADGTSILRGEGVVVRSNASGERPGMTLRFVRLEAAGRALVERIISGRPARSSAPAEARAHPSAWAPPSGPSAAPPAASREAMARPAHREAWAPPVGPIRPQPATPFHPLPEMTPPEPEEVSPDEVAEASGEEEPAVGAGSAATPEPSPIAPEPVEPEPVGDAAAASAEVLTHAEAASEVSDTSAPGTESLSKVSDTSAPGTESVSMVSDTSAPGTEAASGVSDTSAPGTEAASKVFDTAELARET